MCNSVLFGFHCYHELGKEDLSKEKELFFFNLRPGRKRRNEINNSPNLSPLFENIGR